MPSNARYLESAFLDLDLASFKLVYEALAERTYLLNAAPYIVRPLPIMIPIYSAFQVVSNTKLNIYIYLYRAVMSCFIFHAAIRFSVSNLYFRCHICGLALRCTICWQEI